MSGSDNITINFGETGRFCPGININQLPKADQTAVINEAGKLEYLYNITIPIPPFWIVVIMFLFGLALVGWGIYKRFRHKVSDTERIKL